MRGLRNGPQSKRGASWVLLVPLILGFVCILVLLNTLQGSVPSTRPVRDTVVRVSPKQQKNVDWPRATRAEDASRSNSRNEEALAELERQKAELELEKERLRLEREKLARENELLREERRLNEEKSKRDVERTRQEQLLRGADEKAARLLAENERQRANEEEEEKSQKTKAASRPYSRGTSEPRFESNLDQLDIEHLLEQNDPDADNKPLQVFRPPRKVAPQQIDELTSAERLALYRKSMEHSMAEWERLKEVYNKLMSGELPPDELHGKAIVLEPFHLVDPGPQPLVLQDVINVHHNGDHEVWFTTSRPATLEELHANIEAEVQKEKPESHVRHLYNPAGSPLTTIDQVEGDVHYVIDDHYWVWPSPGDLTTQWVTFSDHKRVPVTSISHGPRVLYVEDFMSKEECEHLMGLAKGKLARSQVGSGDKSSDGKSQVSVSQVRTSSTYWVFDKTDIVFAVTKRVEELVNVPMTLSENMQILNYEFGQHYWAHHDYFPESSYDDPNSQFFGKHNRFITVFMYLTDTELGGETNFPHWNGADGNPRVPHDAVRKCLQGVKVKPRQGTVVVFYSMLADGHRDGLGDNFSLHQACDVIKGEKNSANFWVRNRPDRSGGYFESDEFYKNH